MTTTIALWREQAFSALKVPACLMLFLLFLSVFLGMTQGALKVPIFTSLSQIQQAVLWEIRAPRVLMTLATGAGLAMCGLILQALTRNPLADPGIIGVSSFAALFASAAIFLSSSLSLPNWLGLFFVPSLAFIGAFTALLLLLAIASYKHTVNTLVLILTGVALNAGAQTLLGLLTYLSDEETLRVIAFWQMGSYSGISWKQGIGAFLVVFIAYLFFKKHAKSIMLIQLSEQHAKFQGVAVNSLKRKLLIFVAIVTAICVCFTGIVGFIGLVVPHITRMLVGSKLTVLLPCSVVIGASLVTFADVCARLIVTPAELPIGLLTSALGVPFFLGLIMREKRQYTND